MLHSLAAMILATRTKLSSYNVVCRVKFVSLSQPDLHTK